MPDKETQKQRDREIEKFSIPPQSPVKRSRLPNPKQPIAEVAEEPATGEEVKPTSPKERQKLVDQIGKLAYR